MLKQYLPTVISLTIVVLVMFFRLRKAGKGRPLKPNRLWIRPAILLLFGSLALLHPAPITPLNLVIFAVAAVAGVGTGYVLASHQHLTVDAATGAITSRTSPVGMMLFVGVFAVRFVIRLVAMGPDAANAPAAAQSPQALLFTDATLLFALGLVAAQAWETWRRAKALLAEAAAKKAAGAAPQTAE